MRSVVLWYLVLTYFTLDHPCLLFSSTSWHVLTTKQKCILIILISGHYIAKTSPYCTQEGQLKSLTFAPYKGGVGM